MQTTGNTLLAPVTLLGIGIINGAWFLHFRMTQGMFMYIVDVFCPRMELQATRMCKPIPVEKHFATAIWYLATNITYCDLQEFFGTGISTIGEIVLEFYHSVEVDLFGKVIQLGNDVGTVSTYNKCSL